MATRMKKSKTLNRGRDQQIQNRHQTPLGWQVLQSLVTAASTNDKGEGITLVIGAGIHQVPKWNCPCKHASATLLGSWDRLLDAVLPGMSHSTSPSLRWELGILSSVGLGAAQEKSDSLYKSLCGTVAAAEANVLTFPALYEPVRKVLASAVVQNVISLNFDLVAERLLCPYFDPRTGISNGNGKHLTSHYKIHNKRHWHPHGNRHFGDDGCLGIRQYALKAADLETVRNKFKANEKKSGFKTKALSNWLDLMMSSNLIFLGTSLAFSEWDIWFALVNRWRNFAKEKNKRHEPKTFVLTTGADHDHLPAQILRLDATSYNQGWTWLGGILNQFTNGREHCST